MKNSIHASGRARSAQPRSFSKLAVYSARASRTEISAAFRPFFRPLLAVLIWMGVWSCQSDSPRTEPEGGYLAFRQAILSGNSEALWDCLAQETQQVFEDAWVDLNVLAESIQHLSPTDQALARERTALFLLQLADDPLGLFEAMVHLENLVGDEALQVGSEIDKIRTSQNGRQATVTTRAGQEFELTHGQDGVWRVSSLTTLAHHRLRAVSDNVMAVEIMVAESGYMRRSHDEILRLLHGSPEESDEGTGAGTSE